MLLKKALFCTTLTLITVSNVFASKQALNSKNVEGVYSLNSLTGKFTSWGIDPTYSQSSINLASSWKKFKKKKNVIVAVVDTGIQFNHPFLKQNLYITSGVINSQNYGYDFSEKKINTIPHDNHGHGTHVSGIIKSIFPEVKILALKYYKPSASGQDNLNATIKALKFAVDNNVDIINYSGGGPEPSSAELSILKRAEQKGIIVVAAAGNEKSNIDNKNNAYYPASYGLSNIITVGAHDEYNKLIASSNWGPKSVNIAAPGYRIKSAIPGNGAGYMTGTSQATAFVTGVVALLKSQFPNFNYLQIKNILLSSSKKVKTLKDKVHGSGKLDAGNAIEVAEVISNKLNKNNRKVAKFNNK